MPRKLHDAQRPEPLDSADIREFLVQHIPYRLEILRFGEQVCPAKTTRDSAFVEAAIMSGRLLLQFLGLSVGRNGILKVARDYHSYPRGYTDEVKIADVGGRFVNIESLDPLDPEILSKFHNGASKACAHLTWESGHDLGPEVFRRGVAIIRKLLAENLPQSRDQK